jgi:hypothetical protein
MVVFVLALELFNFTQYGSLSPAPGNAALGDGLLQIPPQTGLAGLLFDRQYGLISHFPLLALAVPGMFLAARRRGRMQAHWMLLAVILPYMLAISTFRTWWAGFTPPGRLPVVLVPLLAYYVAVTLQRLHTWIPLMLALLGGMFGFAVTVTGDVMLLGRFTSSGGTGVDPILNWLAARVREPNLPNWLPEVETVPGSGENYWPWYLVFAVCVAVAVLWGKLAPADRLPDRPLWSLVPTPRALLASVRRRPRPAPVAVAAPSPSLSPASAPSEAAPAASGEEPEPVTAAPGRTAPELDWPFPPSDRMDPPATSPRSPAHD